MNAQPHPMPDSDPVRALTLAVEAVRSNESDATRTAFARALLRAGFVPDTPELRGLLARVLAEAWITPRLLFNAAAILIKNGPLRPFIERAAWAWPKPLTAQELSAAGPLNTIYKDELLAAALQSAVAADLDLEKFLTAMRRIVLEQALALDPAQAAPDDLLNFASALARQCHINEYVYRVEKDEKASLDKLFRLLKQKSDAALAPLWVAAAASYISLRDLPPLQRDWPAAVAAIIDQQIAQPETVDRQRASIRRITNIEDDISLAVQNQYEENPFPRWEKVPVTRFRGIHTELRAKFPHADIHGADSGGEFSVLIAGCGTGQQVPEFSGYPHAKTLAIDLSLASLAYAKQKTGEMALSNVEFAQADILKLDLPPESFDLIVSTGVLHHLEEPEAGWRKLVSLLKPGGFMLIGLYSEAARRSIVAAREHIAAKKYRATAHSIRNFRQELISENPDPVLRKILLAPDFYSLSECRDLLFHVQESRFTIPRIQAFLAQNGLAFLGFESTIQAGPEFARHFTQSQHYSDLNHWHAFEQKHPDTFASMYNFWVQKRTR